MFPLKPPFMMDFPLPRLMTPEGNHNGKCALTFPTNGTPDAALVTPKAKSINPYKSSPSCPLYFLVISKTWLTNVFTISSFVLPIFGIRVPFYHHPAKRLLNCQWNGRKLHRKPWILHDPPMKYRAVPVNVPLNQSIHHGERKHLTSTPATPPRQVRRMRALLRGQVHAMLVIEWGFMVINKGDIWYIRCIYIYTYIMGIWYNVTQQSISSITGHVWYNPPNLKVYCLVYTITRSGIVIPTH